VKRRHVLVVDGYNILNAMGGESGPIADARDRLTARLIDYAGFSGQEIVLVYDAWLSDRKLRTEEAHGPVTVVYTRKGETADHYIERLCDEFERDVDAGRMELRVATSDGIEQTLVMGRGAVRVSAREILIEMAQVRTEVHESASPLHPRKNALIERLPEDVRRKLEEMRRGGETGTKR